ncbi:hypothetical protein ES703_24819 [subsurface metagenome]
MIEFRLSTRAITDEPMVEVWRNGTFVAGIYGHEAGVRLVSKYFDGVEYDSGSPPAVIIKLSD